LAQEGPLERVAEALRHFVRSGRLLAVASAALFLVALWAVYRQLSQHTPAQIIGAITDIGWTSILAAGFLVAASYTLITFNDRLALKLIGREVARRKQMAASVAGYAIARSVGYAFLTAATARIRLYASAGLTAAETGRLSLYSGMLAQAGGATAAALGLIAGAHDLLKYVHAPRSLSVAVGVALLLPVFVWLRNNARGGPVEHENAPSFGSLLSHLSAATFAWACAGGVLYLLMPAHGGLHFPAFLAGFVFATVAGALSGVPGGLGVFEATMLAFAPRTQGLPGTAAALIVYRLMYNVAPLIFAATVLALDQWSSARKQRDARQAAKRTALKKR
jgi:phosphatidylglycerol lysyltransferase